MTTREMRPENIYGLKNALQITDWNNILSEDDPDTAYDKLQTKINDLLNVHCPIKI